MTMEDKTLIFKRWCNHCFNICLPLPTKTIEEYSEEDFNFWNSFDFSEDEIFIPSLREEEE